MTPDVLRFTVNGREVAVPADPDARLLDVLRERLGLTGVKEGCGEGECGACSVLLDGRLVNACLLPAHSAAGSHVTTIEAAAARPDLVAIQEALVASGGVQCGFCSPGFVLAISALLAEQPAPTAAQVKQALSGNLCRCTGYHPILAAVDQLVREGAGRPA